MELYNCCSEEEKELQNIDLETLSNEELVRLAQFLKGSYEDAELQDEEIVISALVQISEELGRRVG